MNHEEVRDHSLVPHAPALPANTNTLVQRGIALADALWSRTLSPSGSGRTSPRDIEPVSDDPPERVGAWLITIATAALRRLDLALLLDLLRIEDDGDRWGDMMTPVVTLLEALLLAGDFDAASQLLAVIDQEASGGGSNTHRQSAMIAINALVDGSMVRHIVTHLASIDDAKFERLKALCISLGDVLARPLAEAVLAEEHSGTRARLTAILNACDVIGKQSVERPKRSPYGTARLPGTPALHAPHIRTSRVGVEPAIEPNLADKATFKSLCGFVECKPGVTTMMVDVLAEVVVQIRPVLPTLKAFKKYHSDTFVHMVNVSILTMAQAFSLGMDGPLLGELGFAALMHDIGKVRTPIDILNKAGNLTDAESAIMQRHTIDGAEILRQTPEVPTLAPVVAFEHHLRLDGSGYPNGVKRSSLNLATMLCSIADVYDAMRSQSLPIERILEVLRRKEQFDQHLVRRFTRLIAI
jgi:putative nucleotidyltransferase with HDIG domain